jgi:hypothetical protein
MDDLYQLLREDAVELESKFRRASIEGKGTSQEVADFREHALQDFVSRFFPFPHRVTKGKIRDTFGLLSDSVDCVVCNPNHPYTIDSHGKFRLLLCEGVDSAIEVKPDIAASAELVRGLEQGLSVKALKRRVVPSLMHGGWQFDRAHRVPYVIFAMRCKANPLDTLDEIAAFYKARETPPMQQADFVAVNGIGLFVNYLDESMLGQQGIGPGSDGLVLRALVIKHFVRLHLETAAARACFFENARRRAALLPGA